MTHMTQRSNQPPFQPLPQVFAFRNAFTALRRVSQDKEPDFFPAYISLGVYLKLNKIKMSANGSLGQIVLSQAVKELAGLPDK